MGDGVLIYFGYPQAHEDDAEQAVRAGLAVIEAVALLSGRVTLRVRIGIATGLAVVGDLIGGGVGQERGVVGETPNLAARLQGLAEPDTLVIADAHAPAGRRAVRISPISGRRSLAGFAEPQPAWRVIGESGDGEPVRGAALGRRRRSSGVTRKSSCCSAAGQQAKTRRGAGGADLRRAGHRQVAAHGGAF